MKQQRMLLAALLAASCVARAPYAAEGVPDPVRFEIRKFTLEGNTVLPPDEAERMLAPHRGPDKDFADIQRALALRKLIPTRTLSDERDAGLQTTLAAMIAARLGREAEARRRIEPVLELHPKVYARDGNGGLRNMHDRIEAIGGQLWIEAQPGHGTRVTGAVPLPDPAARVQPGTSPS